MSINLIMQTLWRLWCELELTLQHHRGSLSARSNRGYLIIMELNRYYIGPHRHEVHPRSFTAYLYSGDSGTLLCSATRAINIYILQNGRNCLKPLHYICQSKSTVFRVQMYGYNQLGLSINHHSKEISLDL